MSQSYPFVPFDTDPPDPPHVPESDGTFYTDYGGPGTARGDIAIGRYRPESWDPWEWANSPSILGD